MRFASRGTPTPPDPESPNTEPPERVFSHGPDQRSPEQLFFQTFANLLADEVQHELVQRHVPLLRSEEQGVSAFRHVDRNAAGTPGVYQVTLLEAWPASASSMPAREFLYKYLRHWATNVALKLARTGILTTYPMDLPKAVEHATLGTASDLVLRVILDYSMHDDLQVLRIDALASWDA